MAERTLDRLVEYDPRSLMFRFSEIAEAPRSYTWGVPVHLDQGREGACVGFAWAHELAARPKMHTQASNDLARQIYLAAQKVDEWEGENYSGTSVIAGARVMHERGYMGEYRWAFSVDDLKAAVSRHGPVVMGSWWWTDMFDPNLDGYLIPEGEREGGHAWLLTGYSMRLRTFRMQNSWGTDWGQDGRALLHEEHVESLLLDQGEGCIPLERKFMRELRLPG